MPLQRAAGQELKRLGDGSEALNLVGILAGREKPGKEVFSFQSSADSFLCSPIQRQNTDRRKLESQC
jgi:hypothetical protein